MSKTVTFARPPRRQPADADGWVNGGPKAEAAPDAPEKAEAVRMKGIVALVCSGRSLSKILVLHQAGMPNRPCTNETSPGIPAGLP